MKQVDVATLVDEGRFSGYQRLLVAAAALLIVLDGADNQLLSNAVPSMRREWDLPRAAFANASAAAPFGMIIGGLLGGILGDRIGRSAALLLSVACFSVLTGLVAIVDGVTTLTRSSRAASRATRISSCRSSRPALRTAALRSST